MPVIYQHLAKQLNYPASSLAMIGISIEADTFQRRSAGFPSAARGLSRTSAIHRSPGVRGFHRAGVRERSEAVDARRRSRISSEISEFISAR